MTDVTQILSQIEKVARRTAAYLRRLVYHALAEPPHGKLAGKQGVWTFAAIAPGEMTISLIRVGRRSPYAYGPVQASRNDGPTILRYSHVPCRPTVPRQRESQSLLLEIPNPDR